MFAYTVTPIAKVDFAKLNGHVVKIGADEKRRAENVVSVNDGLMVTHYVMFYKGLEKLLVKVCAAISIIVNWTAGTPVEEYQEAMKTLVNALWLVKHKSTEKRHSKLDGIISISSCCLNNPFCLARMQDKDSICSHCYAASQQKVQHGLTEHNVINGLILQNVGIPAYAFREHMKKRVAGYDTMRIESFGDIASVMQACNYIQFVMAFPTKRVAAWSKNVAMWLRAFDMMGGKPSNLSFVTSSNRVNERDVYNDCRINHDFTVYSGDYIKVNSIAINCGGRSCKSCIENHVGCYFTDTAREIREELK